MPVDAGVVRRRLRILERCIRVLGELKARGRDAFTADEDVQDRVERRAQLAAQACADIALHILGATGRGAPDTYAEALTALAAAGVVPAELAGRVAAAVRLRNLLVHDYADVDHGRLYDELGWIDDAAAFGAAIERWLETEAP